MKTPLSFLFIFLFLLGLCQQKDSLDYDKDGVIDNEDHCPTIKGNLKDGCYKFDCSKKNERDRVVYEEFLKEKKNANYDLLGTEIVKNLNKNYLKKDFLVFDIFNEEIPFICGTVSDEADCPEEYNLINPNYSLKDFLINENFKSFKNNIIFKIEVRTESLKSFSFLGTGKLGEFEQIIVDVNNLKESISKLNLNTITLGKYRNKNIKIKYFKNNKSVKKFINLDDKENYDLVKFNFKNMLGNQVLITITYENKFEEKLTFKFINNTWELIEKT